MRCAISAFTASAMLMSAASAATFSTAPAKDDDVVVTLSGEIAEGDARHLKAVIQRENDDGHTVAMMRLNSPGGSILESVKLADIIRDAKIATSVVGTAKCASACFIVFAAGSEKFASYTASVGVHGASDENGQETVESGAATVSMARIAKDLGVPPSIIGKMVVTPPDEIVWLSPDDLRSMGTTMIGASDQLSAGQQPADRPSAGQLSAGPPSEPQMSSQLPAPDRSTASQPSAPSWQSLLDRAIELSKQQHDGTPDFERVCQPEFKECINGLSAYAFCTMAALSTFLVSVVWFLCANMVIGAFFLFNALPRKILQKWLVLQALIVLPLLCGMIGIYCFSGHDPFDGHGWVPASTLSHVQSVLSAAYFLRISDVSSFALVNSKIAWLGTAGAILACLGAYRLRAEYKASTLLIAATIAMPVALFVVSLFHPFWVTRYLLWSTAPYFVLAGVGLSSAPRYASVVLATTVLAAEFINLGPYYSSDTKPRWDTAAEYLAKRSSGEPIVANDKAAKYVLSAYSPRYGLEPSNITASPDLPRRRAGSGIWVVYGRTGQGEMLSEDVLLQSLSKLGKPIEHANFGRDVSVLYLGPDVGSARADVTEDSN